MLRIIQNSSPAGAKGYYSTSDYYSEGQELTGIWRGNGAEQLGLSGEIAKNDWDALCDNLDPRTGDKLTLRQKESRRVGYDINFHVPKSVSLLYGLTQDERILEAFRESVDATMQDMEEQMQTRVRKDGNNEDRTTGNMVWGEYVHTTARPVDGVPDPHLHAHCFVFNTTFDTQENRWKAGQFAGLKRDAPLYEAMFHSRLARRMEELGLSVERTRKGWELAGIPQVALERFSRRTTLIEEKAAEKGITDPKEKGELGAKTRGKKIKELSLSELRDIWQARLEGEEDGALREVKGRIGGAAIAESVRSAHEAVQRAVSHVFERKSVVSEQELMVAALKSGYGAASVDSIKRELAAQPLLRAERRGQKLVTTRQVLDEERKLVAFAKAGRGVCRQLAGGRHTFKNEGLNAEQRQAVEHVLHSRDRITIIRGGAGTGKTWSLQEMAGGIEAAGKKVLAFAPSAEASRVVLRKDGFASADTVSRLLVDERMQQQLRGQVILVDEAGLLSGPTMAQVCELAGRLDARLVLAGDAGQHASVERGTPLRLLEEEAGLRPAIIATIQRQKRGEYVKAVKAISEGRVADGFNALDNLGWIREVDGSERYQLLARDYVDTVAAGKTALVVSPTHKEGDLITQNIRKELKALNKLSSDEHSVAILDNANLTEAQRCDAVNFAPSDVLVYHQNAKGHTKGDRVTVDTTALPLDQARHFQVFHISQLRLSVGDRIRITRNGKTADGKHSLNNGDLFTVKEFDTHGNIRILENNWTIASDYGHLTYGYCTTSHSSQGKTVQRVIIGQSWDSMPASSQAQFYVSVSRGKESAVIYTDNKEELLQGVSRTEERMTATELMREQALRNNRMRDAERSHACASDQ